MASLAETIEVPEKQVIIEAKQETEPKPDPAASVFRGALKGMTNEPVEAFISTVYSELLNDDKDDEEYFDPEDDGVEEDEEDRYIEYDVGPIRQHQIEAAKTSWLPACLPSDRSWRQTRQLHALTPPQYARLPCLALRPSNHPSLQSSIESLIEL